MMLSKNYQRPRLLPDKKNGKSIAPKKPKNEKKLNMNIKNVIPLLPQKEERVTREEVRKIKRKSKDNYSLNGKFNDTKKREENG